MAINTELPIKTVLYNGEEIPVSKVEPTGSIDISTNGTYDVSDFAQAIVNVVSLPTGIKSMTAGTYVKTDTTASTSAGMNINHGLGEVPDLFFVFYADGNIATTYTELWAMRSSYLAYRSSNYYNYFGFHGNNTTNMSISNGTTYCVRTLDANNALVVSHTTSYYWRPGNYKWFAIKFA